jgi:hypothetical protein
MIIRGRPSSSSTAPPAVRAERVADANKSGRVCSQENKRVLEIRPGRSNGGVGFSSVQPYVARFPVMGPFIEVFVYNQAPIQRKVSVWGYLVS